jgi:hypothetical protein
MVITTELLEPEFNIAHDGLYMIFLIYCNAQQKKKQEMVHNNKKVGAQNQVFTVSCLVFGPVKKKGDGKKTAFYIERM